MRSRSGAVCGSAGDRLAGGLFGLLVGDAVGVPYEFHLVAPLLAGLVARG